MFKLVKFIFWVGATLVLAYFISDIHFAGKSLKQHMDDIFKDKKTGVIRKQAGQLVHEGLKATSKFLETEEEDNEKLSDRDKQEMQKLFK